MRKRDECMPVSGCALYCIVSVGVCVINKQLEMLILSWCWLVRPLRASIGYRWKCAQILSSDSKSRCTWSTLMAAITTDCGVAVRRLALCNAINSAHVAAPQRGAWMVRTLCAQQVEMVYTPDPISWSVCWDTTLLCVCKSKKILYVRYFRTKWLTTGAAEAAGTLTQLFALNSVCEKYKYIEQTEQTSYQKKLKQ